MNYNPKPNDKINESTSFLPGVYYSFFGNKGIIIENCEDIVIDANFSVLIGGKPVEDNQSNSNKDEFSYGYGEMKNGNLGYYDVAVTMKNCKNVTLKNLIAKGFEIGLKIVDCSNCTIENNDFSYNYHNPDWGWDEHFDFGGIVVNNSHNNKFLNNKATNVWSGLVLYNSNDNIVNNNNFSHTSNVGLRLWCASNNTFENNDFSFGIRKKPDEIHARDSSSVLIESGSNYNYFYKNDMRYGGDGLFIRSLNNMSSEFNTFVENDTSFANNNGIEAWDANNVYIRNKANYSSYGFWLGNSDNTLLIENEVKYNGHGFCNAPESFGNAGIACVNGSGSNFIVDGNIIENNNGPGIAIRYERNCKSRNWLIKNNKICNNKTDSRGYVGHGVYLEKASNIHFINNVIDDNQGEAIFEGKDTYNIKIYDDTENYKTEFIKISSSSNSFYTQNIYTFSIDDSYEKVLFIINENTYLRGNVVEFCFNEIGRYNIQVVGFKNKQVHIGYKTLMVTNSNNAFGGLLLTSNWESDGDIEVCNDVTIFESPALKFSKFITKNLFLRCNMKNTQTFDLTKKALRLYLRYNNDFIDWENEVVSPVVTLYNNNEEICVFKPKVSILSDVFKSSSENRYNVHTIDFYDNEKLFEVIKKNYVFDFDQISLYFETKIDSIYKVLIAGAEFIDLPEKNFGTCAFLDENNVNVIKNSVHASGQLEGFDITKIFSNQIFVANKLDGYATNCGEDLLNISFNKNVFIDRLELDFFEDLETYFVPDSIKFEFNGKIVPATNISNKTYFDINEDIEEIKIIFDKSKKMLLYNLKFINKKLQLENLNLNATFKEKKFTNVDFCKIKLNIEMNNDFDNKSNIIYKLFETDESNMLNSNKIYEGILNSENFTTKEITIPLEADLEIDKVYHLQLTQEKIAKSMSVGKYYRWVGGGLTQRDGTYGYINGDKVDDRTNTHGWGKCYLKLMSKDEIFDFSEKNESLGNRFGLEDMQEIYQKFNIENDFKYVKNPNLFSHKKCKCDTEFQIEVVAKENSKIFLILEKGTALLKIDNKNLEIKNKKIEIFLEKDKVVVIENAVSDDSILFIEEI